MNYERNEYRNRVLGCFLGKNAGGTLGMRDEWHRRINHVTYYTHEITGEPLPNDDMDIQLVWLIALEEKGIHIDARTLGDYWMYYVTPHWAEYGNCKINMRMGIQPPFSGTHNNPYTDSCGAYIRSEIWACLAPGCPETAVSYASRDALVDHGEGEGLYAEAFCAAMESAAFVEHDIRTLIHIGLSYIPEECAIAKAVRLAESLYDRRVPWMEARDEILRNFLGGFIFTVSEEDRKKGFVNGRTGWEAPSNIGMIILALLYGEGDFGKTICLAVNCGEDTDCTAATSGALLGILLGIDGIEEKWKAPIGGKLKPACLNLGELGNLGNLLPKDIYELQERIEKLAEMVLAGCHTGMALSDQPCLFDGCRLFCEDNSRFYAGPDTARYTFDFFDIDVTFENGISIAPFSSKKLTFTVHNRYKTSENLNIHIYGENLQVSPSRDGLMHIPEGIWFRNRAQASFTLHWEDFPGTVCRAVAEFTTPSRAGSMLVPLIFVKDITDDCDGKTHAAKAGNISCGEEKT